MNKEDLLEYNIFVPTKADDELLARFKIGQHILLRNKTHHIIISQNENGVSHDYLVDYADDLAYFIPKQKPIYGTVFYTNRGMVYEYMRSIKWMENFIKYANEGTITWT